jgi:hypothetical protein
VSGIGRITDALGLAIFLAPRDHAKAGARVVLWEDQFAGASNEADRHNAALILGRASKPHRAGYACGNVVMSIRTAPDLIAARSSRAPFQGRELTYCPIMVE